MKKFLSIILIVLLCFNWFGYRLVVQYIEAKSDIGLEKAINSEQYNTDDIMEVKMPLNLPYLNQSTIYERINGEVHIKGIYYKYIKRKVANDTIYLLCIRNTAKTHIEIAKSNYYKNTNDLSQSNTGHSPAKGDKAKKAIDNFTVYDGDHFTLVITDCLTSHSAYAYLNYLPSPFNSIVEQPPDSTLA